MNNISSAAGNSVAYQGIEGSFSFLAMQEYFKLKTNQLPASTFGQSRFKDIFKALESNHVNTAVIPIENSLAGSVYEIYDLLLDFNCFVTGEYYFKVRHCLLGIDTEISSLKKVFSHPKAIEQCEIFFDKNSAIEKSVFSDTARAAKFVSESKDPSYAAIASKQAGEIYGLKVIKDNLEDNPHNFTRFLILSNSADSKEPADKCSIIFSLPHTPQSLFMALEQISDPKINISKIQSRPIHGKPFEYAFYIDFDFSNLDFDFVKIQIEKFKEKVNFFKNLGYYKKASL